MDIKINLNLLVLIGIQIFLLVNMTPAESYLISQTNKILGDAITENRKNSDKIFNFGLNLITGILSIKQIGVVSAEEVTSPQGTFFESYNTTNYAKAQYSIGDSKWNCCVRTNSGALCQNVAPGDKESCDNPLPSSCNDITDCKTGCCFDTAEGLCTTNSPKAECEKKVSGVFGIWKDDDACLIEECQRGCCVLGNNVEFVTDKRCEFLSGKQGFKKDFRDLQTEIQCLAIKNTQEFGACIINGACSLKTELECAEKSGKFNENTLCSNSNLGTNCTKQKSIKCVEGKDEIYWFDSCGNRENIYSSDKEKSWNNGSVLSKEKSCGSNSANINSETCGNCNYILGSKCSQTKLGEKSVKDGNFICRDLTCIDEKGDARQNGESWCVYDSFIGDGKDTVGSRHWKRMCVDGEIKVELCADYRGQICVQNEIKNDKGEKFAIANCVINDALQCIGYNQKKGDMKKLCSENSDCVLKKINVDKGFKFDMCTSKYPRGFDLTGEEKAETSSQLCSMANQKCIVLYEKKISGWKCIMNCKCETKKFTEQLNDLCISLGDCGSYVNYIGDGTNNINVKNAPKISWKDYVKYAKVVSGQFAIPKNNSNINAIFGGGKEKGKDKEKEDEKKGGMFSNPINLIGTVAGAGGTIIQGLSYLNIVSLTTPVTTFINGGTFAEEIITTASPTVLGGFATVLSGIGIGMLAGSLLSMIFGLKGDAATIMAVAGLVVGSTLGIYLVSMKAGISACLGPHVVACLVALVILIVIAIILKLLGIGKTKKVKVEFKCQTWQAPTGGVNCEKCNDDLLKPCSKYRCASLGQACELLNKDSEFPVCVAKQDDGKPPIISAGEIQKGFQFMKESSDKVEIRTSTNECVPEFTSVLFSLKTDEYAQCKWDFVRKENYEAMEEFFIEENVYTRNHTTGFMMPSLESLKAEYNLSINESVMDKFANPKVYVKCQDKFGNYNQKEYIVDICVKSGPDKTPALITTTLPVNGAILKFRVAETPLKIYLNEPAECKISREDSSYSNMSQKMDCKTDLIDSDNYGWPCETNLNNLTQEENKFYIKCKDQPWLPAENDSQRNINTNGFIYTLYSSKDELKINKIEPQGIIQSGFEPISVELNVETSGGVENGKSLCYFSFTGYDDMILFFDSFSNTHKQKFSTMMRGEYNVYLKCVDDAGNEALGNSNFTLEVDSAPPIVVRIYNENNALKIITDEDAECYYDMNRCNFNIANATSMSSSYGKEHSAEWNSGIIYYVKCEDVWGNINSECAIKARPVGE